MFGLERRMPAPARPPLRSDADRNGRMFRRTPSFTSGSQPSGSALARICDARWSMTSVDDEASATGVTAGFLPFTQLAPSTSADDEEAAKIVSLSSERSGWSYVGHLPESRSLRSR